ncbi:MAG: GNAT family N-acetyltransferase [Candidatus Firestonebacteria bacterium]|nr:GNAT family N-acetyltransferase [Candidatus Firestonebacteria bacterium]
MIGLLRSLFALEPDYPFAEAKQRTGLQQLIGRGQGTCALVAEAGERVVGMCTVQTVISTAEGGAVGWVEDVVVDPAYRQKSLGSGLMSALEAWAAQQGLKRLQLLADRKNAAAQAFYQKRGWSLTRMQAWRKMLA